MGLALSHFLESRNDRRHRHDGTHGQIKKGLITQFQLSGQRGDLIGTGQHAMGFDPHKTTHHFHLYEDGGAIDVSVNDKADTANRDAIRMHLPHVPSLAGRDPCVPRQPAHFAMPLSFLRIRQLI